MVGNRTKVTVVKNKIAPPFRKVEFDILYNIGISREGDLIDLGITHQMVVKSGTWFSLKHPTEGEVRLGQGRERARQFLADNPDLANELEAAIHAKAAPKPETAPAGESAGTVKPQGSPAPPAKGEKAPGAKPPAGKPEVAAGK